MTRDPKKASKKLELVAASRLRRCGSRLKQLPEEDVGAQLASGRSSGSNFVVQKTDIFLTRLIVYI